jgi:hypothetical protein
VLFSAVAGRLLDYADTHQQRELSAGQLNPAVLTETLSMRLPLDFIKALIAAARAKNVTLSHHVRDTLKKSTVVKSE